MRIGFGCLALVAMVGMGLAQGDKPAEPGGYYRLDFVVKELEGGKVVNARAHSTTLSTDRTARTSIRSGNRVPLPGKDGSISYMEVGTSVDCSQAKLVGGEFAVNLSVDISSVAEPGAIPPVIRSFKWTGDALVALRKPTVVFSSDDAMSKRQMQVEMTATPIK